jgi:hypothetical protein
MKEKKVTYLYLPLIVLLSYIFVLPHFLMRTNVLPNKKSEINTRESARLADANVTAPAEPHAACCGHQEVPAR